MRKETLLLLLGILLGFAIGYLLGEKQAEQKIQTIVEQVQKSQPTIQPPIVHSVQPVSDIAPHDSHPSLDSIAISQPVEPESKAEPAKPKTVAAPAKPKITAAPVEPKASTKTITADVSPNALTVAAYVHDWVKREATLTLKNNTDQTITGFSARIIYKSMGGEILDYRDISKDLTIEPHLAKSFKLEGYGYDLYYAYYKSEIMPTNPDRKYKIEFKLNSIKVR